MSRAIIASVAALAGVLFMHQVSPAWSADLLSVDGKVLKWGDKRLGAGATVTYALLDEDYQLAPEHRTLSERNCRTMRGFADIVSRSPGVMPGHARRELREAFAEWERAGNLRFVEVDSPAAANIVIGAAAKPRGKAYANLSFNSEGTKGTVMQALESPLEHFDAATPRSPPAFRVAPIEQAFVCLSMNHRWKVGFDGDLDVYDLRYTFTHEIGHAVGLDHPSVRHGLMNFQYGEKFRTLQTPDIMAARRLYGPPVVGPDGRGRLRTGMHD